MKPTLRLEILHDPTSFWSIKEEWMGLIRNLPRVTPFLTPHWTGLSFEYFASDEELDLVVLRNEKGDLVGIVPMVRIEENGTRRVSLLQNWEMTPYADWIVLPPYRTIALEDIFTHFTNLYREDGLIFSMQFLREDSPIINPLERLARDHNIELRRTEAFRISELVLPNSFERFIYSLKKPLREKLQKKLSKTKRQYDLNVRMIEVPEEINENLDHFFRLFRRFSNERDEFLTPGREAFLREVFLLLARERWFKLYMEEADGWKISGCALLDFGDTYYIYTLGVDPSAMNLSPLDLMLYSLVEEAILRGKRRVEILEPMADSVLFSLGKKVRIMEWVLGGDEAPIKGRSFLSLEA